MVVRVHAIIVTIAVISGQKGVNCESIRIFIMQIGETREERRRERMKTHRCYRRETNGFCFWKEKSKTMKTKMTRQKTTHNC